MQGDHKIREAAPHSILNTNDTALQNRMQEYCSRVSDTPFRMLAFTETLDRQGKGMQSLTSRDTYSLETTVLMAENGWGFAVVDKNAIITVSQHLNDIIYNNMLPATSTPPYYCVHLSSPSKNTQADIPNVMRLHSLFNGCHRFVLIGHQNAMLNDWDTLSCNALLSSFDVKLVDLVRDSIMLIQMQLLPATTLTLLGSH